MVEPEPSAEHRWLQQLVGEWTYEHDGHAVGDEPPPKMSGKETIRSIGEYWIVGEGQGDLQCGGGPAHTMVTLGFDPQKGRFVGTWVGSMMTLMWVYDGWLDESGKVLTLECEGPSFAGDGTTARYQDIWEVKSDNLRTLTSRTQNADGTWNEFMTSDYHRA